MGKQSTWDGGERGGEGGGYESRKDGIRGEQQLTSSKGQNSATDDEKEDNSINLELNSCYSQTRSRNHSDLESLVDSSIVSSTEAQKQTCCNDPKHMFTQFGCVVGVFGVVMDLCRKLLAEFMAKNFQAAALNSCLLLFLYGPTLVALLIVLLKDPIKMLRALVISCIKNKMCRVCRVKHNSDTDRSKEKGDISKIEEDSIHQENIANYQKDVTKFINEMDVHKVNDKISISHREAISEIVDVAYESEIEAICESSEKLSYGRVLTVSNAMEKKERWPNSGSTTSMETSSITSRTYTEMNMGMDSRINNPVNQAMFYNEGGNKNFNHFERVSINNNNNTSEINNRTNSFVKSPPGNWDIKNKDRRQPTQLSRNYSDVSDVSSEAVFRKHFNAGGKQRMRRYASNDDIHKRDSVVTNSFVTKQLKMKKCRDTTAVDSDKSGQLFHQSDNKYYSDDSHQDQSHLSYHKSSLVDREQRDRHKEFGAEDTLFNTNYQFNDHELYNRPSLGTENRMHDNVTKNTRVNSRGSRHPNELVTTSRDNSVHSEHKSVVRKSDAGKSTSSRNETDSKHQISNHTVKKSDRDSNVESVHNFDKPRSTRNAGNDVLVGREDKDTDTITENDIIEHSKTFSKRKWFHAMGKKGKRNKSSGSRANLSTQSDSEFSHTSRNERMVTASVHKYFDKMAINNDYRHGQGRVNGGYSGNENDSECPVTRSGRSNTTGQSQHVMNGNKSQPNQSQRPSRRIRQGYECDSDNSVHTAIHKSAISHKSNSGSSKTVEVSGQSHLHNQSVIQSTSSKPIKNLIEVESDEERILLMIRQLTKQTRSNDPT